MLFDSPGATGVPQDLISTSATAPLRQVACCVGCAFGGATQSHHNRLLGVEEDPDGLLELMELAVTWPELDYSELPVIPPDRWMGFVHSHRWADPQRVERVFSVATDIAMTVSRAGKQRFGGPDCLGRPNGRAELAAGCADAAELTG